MLVGQATCLTEEQLMDYFFAGLQINIRSQIWPHNPKDLMRAMEIARDVEEVSRDVRTGERITFRSNSYPGRFQGSEGIVLWVETLKGTQTEPRSSSDMSTARKDGGEVINESKVGSSSSGENKTRVFRNLPYPEYVK